MHHLSVRRNSEGFDEDGYLIALDRCTFRLYNGAGNFKTGIPVLNGGNFISIQEYSQNPICE